MKTTLGRNVPNGDYAAVVEDENGCVYLTCYKQKDGSSNLKEAVTKILLTKEKLDLINEIFGREEEFKLFLEESMYEK
jgi:hypothetical protein